MLDQAQKLRQLVGEERQEGKPKIITVTSGKGGVGKSNVVVNLAISLAKMGKRVMIFDADMGMGNDDVLMGFLPKYSVFDIIFSGKEIEEVIISGPFGVKLLPGGSGLSKVDELTESQRELFLEKLTSITDLDYIIMDTGAGINRSVLGFISCCEELIIITTPEPTSLTDAYSLLKAVAHFKIKNTAKVIINRTFDEKEAHITFEKLYNAAAKFLKVNLEYLGTVSEDRKVTQAVRQQQPFVVSYPHAQVTLDVERIARNLEGNKSERSGLGVQGLFKKIFSIFS